MADKTVSPLRQRLIDDMTTRRLSHKTQWAYVHSIKNLATFVHCPPHKATTDDLRLFRLELARSGLSVTAVNQTILDKHGVKTFSRRRESTAPFGAFCSPENSSHPD